MRGGLYVYAILSEAPVLTPGRGVREERVSVLAAGGLLVAVGRMNERPPATPLLLGRHDRVIRELSSMVASALPCRFGEWAAGLAELEDRMAARSEELLRLLLRVRGCEQMTLRLFGPPCDALSRGGPGVEGGDGPGVRYLRRRLRRADLVAASLGALRRHLGDLLRGEQVELHASGRLLASVYYLLPRGEADAYARALGRLGAPAEGVRLVTSGPWPPYSFARGDFHELDVVTR